MTKKIITIFVSLIILLGTCKVQAVSIAVEDKIEPTKTKLENLIEYNTFLEWGTKWEYLEVNKYYEPGMVIYKEGNSPENGNVITVSYPYTEEKFTKLLQHGYGNSNLEEIKNLSEDDAYFATKVAIDCFMQGRKADVVDEYYRVGADLTGKKLERAEGIIKAVKKLLEKAFDNTNPLQERVNLSEIGETKIDDLDENYYSQEYQVEVTNTTMNGYTVSVSGDATCVIVNADNNQVVEDGKFDSSEPKFKVKVLREAKEGSTRIKVKVSTSYNIHQIFMGSDTKSMYDIYTTFELVNNKTKTMEIEQMTLPEKKDEGEEKETGKEEIEDNKDLGKDDKKEETEGKGETADKNEDKTEEKGEEETKKEEGDKTEKDKGSEDKSNEENGESEKEPEKEDNKKEEIEDKKEPEVGKEESKNETGKTDDINKEEVKEETPKDDIEIKIEESEPNKEPSGSQKEIVTEGPGDNVIENDNEGYVSRKENDKSSEEKNNNEGKTSSEEINNNEETTKNEGKTSNEEINNNEKLNSNEAIIDKEETPNGVALQKEKLYNNYVEAKSQEVLPRTGADHFIFKLILANLILFLSFEILILKKKKQTANSNSLHIKD